MKKSSQRIEWVEKETLTPYMTLPVDKLFETFEGLQDTKESKITVNWEDDETQFIHIDNGAPVLLVAHLDTVEKPRLDKMSPTKLKGAGFDDRLGAYLAMQVSKYRNVDILFTDHEEIGQSTAEFFDMKESYNWVAEFDRKGEDVVTYGIDSKEWRAAIDSVGYKQGQGAFSDICFLETEVCCVNIGIGYQKAHDKHSYVVLAELDRQMEKFLRFYDEFSGRRFECDALADFPLNTGYGDYGNGGWERASQHKNTYGDMQECGNCGCFYDGFIACPECQSELTVDTELGDGDGDGDGNFVCSFCYREMENYANECPYCLEKGTVLSSDHFYALN